MTGSTQILLASSFGGIVNGGSNALQILGLTGSTHAGEIDFLSDGTITFTYTGTPAGTPVNTPNWFAPTTTGIGSSYFVKFTLNSGVAWDAGLAAGTVFALNTTRLLKWTALTGIAKLANVTASFYADAGGTILVGTQTISADIESNN